MDEYQKAKERRIGALYEGFISFDIHVSKSSKWRRNHKNFD